MRKEILPFSLQGYNTGNYQVENRKGEKVTIHNVRETVENYPILAEIEETDKSKGRNLQVFTIDGKYRCDGGFAENDLMLVRDVYERGDIVKFTRLTDKGNVVGIAILKHDEYVSNKKKYETLVMIHLKNPVTSRTNGRIYENVTAIFDVCQLANDEEKEQLFEILNANKKRYYEEKKEIVDVVPVAKIEEYEPIGKVYESGVVINTKLTRAQKLDVIKALAESLK